MPRALSLHIGLNSVDPAAYSGWDGQLVACENDAHSMQGITSSLGYQAKSLLTKEATSEAVIRSIASAAQELTKNDMFVLTYSGHGGQVPDTNGDEPDGRDETWVLYDRQLVDDELHELYTRFQPGVRILVLSDSCHSGTVTRAVYDQAAPIEAQHGFRSDPIFRPKRIPREIEGAVYDRNRKTYEKIQAETKEASRKSPEATVILISGCQDNQLSSDGDVNGLFTEKLLRTWDNGKFKRNYRHFQRAIKQKMPPSQQPNYFVVGAANQAFERQRPFVIATVAAAGHS
jgi:Caspase domain.